MQKSEKKSQTYQNIKKAKRSEKGAKRRKKKCKQKKIKKKKVFLKSTQSNKKVETKAKQKC